MMTFKIRPLSKSSKPALSIFLCLGLTACLTVNPITNRPPNRSEYESTKQAIPRIIFFEAQPPFVVDGSSTTLRWRTDHAESAQISGIGTVKVTDNREVTPGEQTTYRLVATNSTGQTVSDDITISLAIFKKGELPNEFKIRAIKHFNKLNPRKTLMITPQTLRQIDLKMIRQHNIEPSPAKRHGLTGPETSPKILQPPRRKIIRPLNRIRLQKPSVKTPLESQSSKRSLNTNNIIKQKKKQSSNKSPTAVLPEIIRNTTFKKLPAQNKTN